MPRILQPTAEIPSLETKRLRLRGHRLDDFANCAAMWADPLTTRYIGGKPLTEEEAWARFLRYAGYWSLLGFGYWVAEEKSTGNYLGELGFADLKRHLQPSLPGVPEIGWVFASAAHGQGYATEAVRAALTWGDAHFRPAQTFCLIHPENDASIRVAAKCGYKQFQITTYNNRPTTMFVRDPTIQHQS